MAETNFKFALITPSYAPDFERCQLLVDSVNHCLTDDSKHYIIVDRRDVPLFEQLTSERTKLLVVEDILPSWIFRAPGLKGWWLSFRTFPIRNWVLQQLVKMSVCDVVDEEFLVFCDSDNTFVHPFNLADTLLEGDRLALLRVELENVYDEWTAPTKEILGISDKDKPAAIGKVDKTVGYVSNMIAWRKSNVLKMRQHIESVHGRNWIQVICRYRTISEYMIYGIFVENVLGLDTAKHFQFDTELMKPSWGNPLADQAAMDAFFDEVQPSHLGIMIHSKDNVPVARYRDRVQALWPS